MKRFRGIIALDIDGTITTDPHLLAATIVDYLNHLIHQQWCVVFISGRTFSFARPILSQLIGTYYFAVQNGAALYEMPQVTQIKQHYLPGQAIQTLEAAIAGETIGLLVECGKERDDICYYKPDDFSSEERKYIDYRIKISPGLWVAVNSFEDLDIHTFACGKIFSSEKQAQKIAKKIPYRLTTIKDPFRPGYYLAHINALAASKGHILQEFIAMYPGLPIIVGGDDANDISMLQLADVKIVMSSAPHPMHAMADILAQPAEKQGILTALEEAINERIHHLK